MAYSGFLLRIGNYEFPRNYIKADSYSAYVTMQDLDPWTDEDGYVHRNAVKLKAEKVEFETKPMLTNIQFSEIMKNIQRNYTIPQGRQLIMTAYIPEYDDYLTQTGYMADITPSIYLASDKIIQYNAIRFAFIGGVYDG